MVLNVQVETSMEPIIKPGCIHVIPSIPERGRTHVAKSANPSGRQQRSNIDGRHDLLFVPGIGHLHVLENIPRLDIVADQKLDMQNTLPNTNKEVKEGGRLHRWEGSPHHRRKPNNMRYL